jgi:hypothetical protein
MVGRSIKVQAYHNDELIKQYYVGHENMENDATYMILTNLDNGENYEEPFLMCIPGFNGYLSSRYILSEDEWRDRLVLNYIPPQLKSIKLDYTAHKDSSFTIDLQSTTSFELKKADGKPLPFDEAKMKQYLAYFQNVNYEKLLNNFNKRLVDSVRNAIPFLKMTITDKSDKVRSFSFVYKYSTPELNQKYGVNYKYDPDRLFLVEDATKDVSVIQYYVFGKIMQTFGYFLPKSAAIAPKSPVKK